MNYLCIGPQVWGKSDSPEKARKNAEKELGKKMKTFVIKQTPDPKAYIDDMGGFCWHLHGEEKDGKDLNEPRFVTAMRDGKILSEEEYMAL